MGEPQGLRARRFVLMLVCAAMAVLPASYLHERTAGPARTPTAGHTGDVALDGGGHAPELSVDGSLPRSPNPVDLRVFEVPDTGPLGIPESAMRAYRDAARTVGRSDPACRLDWALLASVGRIESNHARGGYVDTTGTTLEPILGPVLNGRGAVAAISDTDGGQWDGDRRWDRAIGPMQFIPGTWQRYGADGDGDGTRDPNNLVDAAVAAGRYLCSGGADLREDAPLRAAIYRYNNSDAYVETVLRWAQAYREGVDTVPDSDVPLAVPDAGVITAPSPVERADRGRSPDRQLAADAPGQDVAGHGTTTSEPSAVPTTTSSRPTSTRPTTTTPTSTSPTPEPCASEETTDPPDPTETTPPTSTTEPTPPPTSTTPTCEPTSTTPPTEPPTTTPTTTTRTSATSTPTPSE